MKIKTTIKRNLTRQDGYYLKTITSVGHMEKREAWQYGQWDYKLVELLWKTIWRFLQNLKRELPYDLAIPPLDIYPKELKSKFQRHTPMFIVELFTIAKIWKQSQCPSIDECKKKMWCIHTREYSA